MVAFTLIGGAIVLAQTTMPVTAPTTLAAPASSAPARTDAANGGVADSGVPVATAKVGHDAVVHSVNGKVEVVADGSSLNQILREIARVAGMKITGGVEDEPVYGTYGPARASEVLSTLLDGTGTNMLLRESTAAHPGELILTPRIGGVTPPDPNAASQSTVSAEPNVPGSRNYQRPREPWMGPAPITPPGMQGGSNPGQDGGPSARPNPQQIYQQLQRLQQTQQAVPQAQPNQQ